MNLNLATVNAIIHVMTLLFAYFMVIGPAGYFRAWVAQKMGDDTGYHAGMMTLNPFAHIDIIGMIVLFIFGAGWGRFIPINPQNIYGPHRRLKLFCAYFSDVLAHLVMGVGALLLLAVVFGVNFGTPSMLEIQLSTSWIIVLVRILVTFVVINVFLAMISIVMNGVMFALVLLAERSTTTMPYFYYILLFGPLLLLFFFGQPLMGLLSNGILFIAKSLASLFGLLGK